MGGFAKLFKNIVVLLENGKTTQVIKWGCSVRINQKEGKVEIYRERGSFGLITGSSKGKLMRFKYKGTPTIEGLYRALNLPITGGSVCFLRKTILKVESCNLCSFTEEVEIYDYLYRLTEGSVLEVRALKGDKREVGYIEPPVNVYDFLSNIEKLWKVVDHL